MSKRNGDFYFSFHLINFKIRTYFDTIQFFWKLAEELVTFIFNKLKDEVKAESQAEQGVRGKTSISLVITEVQSETEGNGAKEGSDTTARATNNWQLCNILRLGKGRSLQILRISHWKLIKGTSETERELTKAMKTSCSCFNYALIGSFLYINFQIK